jgi:hypothetical protein
MTAMMRVLKVKEAQKILAENGFNITVVRLEMGLRQRVFPFGDAVEMPSGTWAYAVYSVLLDRWIAERSAPNG